MTDAERKQRQNERAKRWRDRNPGKVAAAMRRLREQFPGKMTQQSRESKWRSRGYPAATRSRPQLCECCGNPPGGKGVLHLDHDHTTGAFRGWLCWQCNTGLGKLGDNLAGVLRAVDYLKRNG